MADNLTSTHGARRVRRHGLPSMTERQLQAYLLARDVLRRVREGAPPALLRAPPHPLRA